MSLLGWGRGQSGKSGKVWFVEIEFEYQSINMGGGGEERTEWEGTVLSELGYYSEWFQKAIPKGWGFVKSDL